MTEATVAPKFNLVENPIHHHILASTVHDIHTALSGNANIRFYVSGGAAAAYILLPTLIPITDIDCVCLLNPTLPEKDFNELLKKSNDTIMSVVKKKLTSLSEDDRKGLLKEISLAGRSVNEALKFRVNAGIPANLTLKNANSNIQSPFTGTFYKHFRLHFLNISVRHRTAPSIFEAPPLLDIVTPTYEYKQLKEKWAATEKLELVMPFLGQNFHILSLEALIADLEFTVANPGLISEEKQKQRIDRLSMLKQLLAIRESIKTFPSTGGGGAASGSIVGPPLSPPVSMGPVGGAGAQPPLPPVLTVTPTSEGRARLDDHLHRLSWSSIGYNSKTDSFLFTSGFEGPYGNYWEDLRSPTGYSWERLSSSPSPPTPWPIPPINPEATPWFTILTDGRKFMQNGSGMVYHSVDYNDTNGFIFNDKTYGHPGHYYRHKTFKNPKTGYLQTIRWHL